MGSYAENMSFEAEVRRVAEAVWQMLPGECQPQHYVNAGPLRELDGLARLRDVSHLLMVTTSTKLSKVKEDVAKLEAARKVERATAASINLWLITEKQLDAEHIRLAGSHSVVVLTLEQFRRRYFDGHSYIALRRNAPFGSARNLRDDSVALPTDAYVPLPMRAIQRSGPASSEIGPATPVDIGWIAEKVVAGETVVLTAPFGAGKSLTTREVFNQIAGQYLTQSVGVTPVAINLRDHWGQDDFDEILDRHARKIAFGGRRDLVAAWRAGMVCLLVDGFDEVGSQGVVSRDNKRFLSDARFRGLTGLRQFVANRPAGAGVFLCGRDHYFDNHKELRHALGLSGATRYWDVQLDEFDDSGLAEFLRRNGADGDVPEWLPRKPLLMAYVVHNELLENVLSIDGSKGFGYVWDEFLSRICARESASERAEMDPSTVRRVLEFLAYKVRASRSGLGPVSSLDLADAYERVAGSPAAEGVLPQLQRLPALTAAPGDAGERFFVDEGMLHALQGSAFENIATSRLSGEGVAPMHRLPSNAISMAAYLSISDNLSPETIVSLAQRGGGVRQKGRGASGEDAQFVGDCVEVATELASMLDEDVISFNGLAVDGAEIGVVRLDEIELRHLEFRNCIVAEIRLAAVAGKRYDLKFVSCDVGKVSGAAERSGVPSGLLDESSNVDGFENLSTNAAVLRSKMPPGLKAAVTILRKLYKQSGGGRKLAAFRRGVTDAETATRIDEALKLVVKHGFARIFNQVAHPVRNQSGRVEQILAAPELSTEEVCVEARVL